jgi:polygalacturonase
MIRPVLFWAFMLTGAAAQSQTGRDADSLPAYNILRYGAKPDGQTVNTTAIQAAVNDCHRHGGGRIIIPAGNFVTGTVELYSNMDLDLEPGAVLAGSENDKDYLYQKRFGFSGPGAGVKTGILVAQNEQNISISGSGTIDGRGSFSMYMDSLQQGEDFNAVYTRQQKDYMNPKYGRADGPVLWKGTYEDRPGVMVIFSDCKNISVSHIKFQESPNWTIAFLNSSDIKITGITIENIMSIPNSDGIDLYDSKNITISDCVIQAGDDAIAVISSSNLAVTNCILHSRSSGIRVGYNVFNDNDSGNLLFNNITIYDSNRGIGIFQRRGGNMDNMIFSNIIINTRLHSGQWWGHGEPIHISVVPGLGSRQAGSVTNLRFSNITASSESGIVVFASQKGLLRNISFDNIQLTIRQSALAAGYGGNIDLRPTNDVSLGIFSHSIPAFYSFQADELSVRNLAVHWGSGLPAYFTHAVECSGFESLTLDGVREQPAKDGMAGSSSVVYLEKGGTAVLRDIFSTDAGKKPVLTDNSTHLLLK